MSTLLTQPRQVRILKCSIYSPGMELRGATAEDRTALATGFDIRPYIRRVDVYESIFNNTLSGNLTIMEDVGLLEYLPIVGVELLVLSFAVDDEDGKTQTFTNVFRVTKVHDITYPRHQYRLYKLEFTSREFIYSIGQRISRAFSGKRCDEVVREILTKDLQSEKRIAHIERTHGKVNVTIPNYTPLQAINYFAVLSQTEKSPRESNFLFYETLDGFFFTSIHRLIEEAKNQKKMPVFNIDPSIAVQNQLQDETARNAALRMHQEQSFDLLHDIAAGTLRAHMVHFDILARELSDPEDSRYTETFKKTTHLDKHPVYPNNYDRNIAENVRVFTVPSNAWIAGSKYMRGKKESDDQQNMRESIILRNRQLREIQHIQTLLDLPGQPDLRAGSIVVVNYPATRTLSTQDTTNVDAQRGQPTPLYSGKHIITDVHHIITFSLAGSAEYRMNVKACRDSLGSPLIGEVD